MRIDQKFNYGESYIYHVVPYEDIDSNLPNKPGIYSWHYRIMPESLLAPDSQEVVSNLYWQSSLGAIVKGNMRLEYNGRLVKKEQSFPDLDLNFLSHCLVAMGPPLYIGRSIKMGQR